MLQPDKLKKLNENAMKMAEAGSSKEDILAMKDAFVKQFGVEEPIKKKESTSVSPQKSSGSVQTNGSSVTQDIDPKTGFPKTKPLYNTIPDTQELGSAVTPQQKEYKLKQELSKVKVTPENMEEVSRKTDELSALQKTNKIEGKRQKKAYQDIENKRPIGTYEYLSENLKSGEAQAIKGIASIPALVYDVAAFFTNPLIKALGYEGEEASSKKIAKDLGFTNYAVEGAKDIIESSSKKIEKYNNQNGGDALTALRNGKISGAAKIISGTTLQSLPNMILAMASGGSTTALGTIGATTAASKYEELDEKNPELSQAKKLSNALVSGGLEAFMGHFISGTSGAVIKNILKEKGVETGSKIIANSFKKTASNVIEKSPMVGFFGEMLEESLVEAGNQWNDIETGIRAEFDLKSIANAGISATGMGGLQTGVMYGAKAYVGAKNMQQLKEVNKKVVRLQKELDNPNLSEEQKATIKTTINDIYDKSKRVLGSELKKFQAIPEAEKVELLDIDGKLDDLDSEALEIKHSNDYSDETKEVLLGNLKEKYVQARNRKEEILSKSPKINFAELPIKEQEKVKKQALESLVTELNPDGKKDMTITDQMITKRANEIYSESKQNENAKIEVPTPEAESKTEVQKQPEAEKVKTPQVEVKTEVVEKPSDEKQLEEIKNGDVVSFTYENKSEIPEIFKDKISSEGEINGKKKIKVTIAKSLAEYHLQNETPLKEVVETAPELTPQQKIEQAKQARLEAKAKIDAKRNAPKEVVAEAPKIEEPKAEAPIVESKPKNTVKRVKSIKDSEYDVEFDENDNDVKVTSVKTGKEIKKYTVVKDKKTGKEKLTKNSNYSKIVSDSRGELTTSQEKTNNKKEIDKAIKNFEPTNEYDHALNALASGAKVDVVSLNKEVGNTDSNWATNKSSKVELPSIEVLAEQIWNNNPDLDVQEVRNALIEIIGSNSSIDQVKQSILDNYTENSKKQQEQEAHAFLGSLTEKERAIYDVLKAEDDFISELTDEEVLEYFEQEYNVKTEGYEPKGKQVEQSADIKGDSSKKSVGEKESTSKTNELETKKAKAKEKVTEASQVRKEAKEKPTKQDRKDIANAKIDDIVNSINSIDSIFGIKIKVDDVDGLNKNGIDIVKVIASIVKQAVFAGIEIDDAISKTIEHFKKSYDFELSDKDKIYIKNFAEPKLQPKIEPKVEADKADKTTDKAGKNYTQEETVSKKASELGISDAQYEKLRDDAKAIPESGEYGKYLSGETIEDVFDEPARNDQGIQTTRLQLLTQHGEQFITKAKNLFEGNYVDKTLTFLKNSNLNSFEKGVIYASMVNEANILTKEYPDNADYKAQQDAIYEDYQANLRVGALTVNSGRLIRILNAIEKGVDVGAFTGKLYSGKQKEAKQVLENAVPTPENLNKIDDEEAKIYTQEELDAEIEKAIQQEKVESKKGGIPYKPKSNAKKVKAQQAITAIEKIQKRLRSKTYDASIGVPIAIIDGGLTVIKKSIQAGVTLSEAIERGINHIKNEYGQKWAKEDEFRKDMYDEFSKEGIDVRKQPNSISKVPDVIKEALIDAGFGREVKAKKTTVDENGVKTTETVVRNVLDWNKLFGNVGSIENLKRNVEEQLKKQGKTDTEIKEIQKELEAEYKRLSEKIVDKALADLERRNLITPSPNRKSDAETLALLFRQGLFNQNMDKYENVLNKALGFTTKQQDVFDEIKKQVELLNDLYEVKVDGKPLTELQMKDASNKIKRAINLLIFESVMREAPTRVGLSLAFQQILFFGMRGVLGSIHNLTENRVSSKVQIALTEFKSGVKLTNELKDLIKKAQYNVRSDMNLYGGQAYGDTSMSLLTHSIIDDIANNKIKGKILQGLYNVATLRTFLDAADSGAKVRLTMNHFITNSVNILTTKSDTRPAMSKVDAIKFVSEALTGDNFEKAKETAKNILESINEKEGKQVFKTHDQAVFRFALDIVTKNLNSGDIMTMEQIEASFKAGEASAGSSIGHNANNWLTEQFNKANNSLSKHQEKALQEKEWNESMFRIAMSTLMKTGALMFKGGGTNWTVIGADKGIPLFGLAHAYYFKLAGKTKGIDLNTEIGNKYLEKELYFQGRYRDTMARAIWAIGMFTVASLVMQTKWGDDDDEETNAKKLAKWLNKPENKYFKKAFTKVSPLAFSLMVAKEGKKEELGKYLGDLFSLGDNYYDNGTQLIRSINSDQKGTTKGALGKIATSSINAPMGWKIVKDVLDIYRGLMGYPPLKNDKKAIRGFLEGAKRGGFIEWVGNVNEEGIIVEPKKRERTK